MDVYPYKMQVQIVMALHNYIRRRLHDETTFKEFPSDFLVDVVVC